MQKTLKDKIELVELRKTVKKMVRKDLHKHKEKRNSKQSSLKGVVYKLVRSMIYRYITVKYLWVIYTLEDVLYHGYITFLLTPLEVSIYGVK